MDLVQSITPIYRVIPTQGSRPVHVTCSDGLDYICKCACHTPATLLRNELLGSRFLEIWGIPTPPIKFVSIKREHVTDEALNAGLRHSCFIAPLFGSQYLDASVAVDKLSLPQIRTHYTRNQITNHFDLLRIALFDIWMCNEDRNDNNYNLILAAFVPEGKAWMAIDHEKCFNSNIGLNQLTHLCFNETLISSAICKELFRSIKRGDVDRVVQPFVENVEFCLQRLPEILACIPVEWQINTSELQNALQVSIFTPEWISQTERHFREFIQMELG